MSETEIKKGLDGVIVDVTSISKVMPEINSLVYRGYPVQDLADQCVFEEVAYLLWHEDLPTEVQLREFVERERTSRGLSSELLEVIKTYNHESHPMDTLRTSVSYLGQADKRVWEDSRAVNLDKAIQLLAKIPTCIAADYRLRSGLNIVPPREDLGISENFFHMCFGEVPDAETIKAFDASLILYAEHSFNASTFTARVITSTQSDLYSAITGAIGALKGPLHGGANEQVMHMLKEIEEPQKSERWLLDALKQKRKVMGFGHRVYKKGDSRVPTMKKYAQKMAQKKNQNKWMEISQILEETMIREKNIYPNLDFPAGPAYYTMGFEIEMFTPIFVMARVTGWAAHVMEQAANNRIIRPLSAYEGPAERKVSR